MESNNVTALDIDKLYEEYTSKEQIKDSFDKITAPSGRYTFTATKVETQMGGPDHPFESLRDRKFVHVWGKMTETLPDGTQKKRGHIGFDASWENRQDRFNRQDREAKLWGQLVRAFGMNETNPVPEIVNALNHYPVSLFVSETFKVPDDSKPSGFAYVTVKGDDVEKRRELRGKGYESRNYVKSISRV